MHYFPKLYIQNKVLRWVENIRILSSYHVGSRIWNPNSQFVTSKKKLEKFKKELSNPPTAKK
jgi:hypothetical protein